MPLADMIFAFFILLSVASWFAVYGLFSGRSDFTSALSYGFFVAIFGVLVPTGMRISTEDVIVVMELRGDPAYPAGWFGSTPANSS